MHAAIRECARHVAAIDSDSPRYTNCRNRIRQLSRRIRVNHRTDSLRCSREMITLGVKMVAEVTLQIHERDVNKESLCSS